MKRLVHFPLLLILTFIFSVFALGQETKNEPTLESASCESNGIKFICPEGFERVHVDNKTGLAFLRHKKYKLGLFVIAG